MTYPEIIIFKKQSAEVEIVYFLLDKKKIFYLLKVLKFVMQCTVFKNINKDETTTKR